MGVHEPNPYESPKTASATAPSSDTEFVLSGALTVEDALAAHRLATRGFIPRLVLVTAISAAFSLVLVAMAVSSRPYSPQASNVMLLVASIVFPGLLVARYLLERVRLRHFARKKLGIFASTHSVLSPAGIVATSEYAKTELDWRIFSRCTANDSVAVLFYRNSRRYFILARSKLQRPEQWNAFVDMVQHQLEVAGGV